MGADPAEGLRQVSVPTARIPEGRQPVAKTGAGLLHARPGRNRDPVDKLADFSNLMQDGLGRSIDLVLMTFCYVDPESEAAVLPLFAAYRQCIGALSAALPTLAVGHAAVPLKPCPTGMLGTLQRMLRGAAPGLARNAVRENFNAPLGDEYAESGPLRDLARIESRHPGGKAISARQQGARMPVLAPERTRDGVHLNDLGCRVVAMEFPRFLGRAAKRLGRKAS